MTANLLMVEGSVLLLVCVNLCFAADAQTEFDSGMQGAWALVLWEKEAIMELNNFDITAAAL